MHSGRLEAFSDGVLAVIITIMVLELRVPEGHDFASLWRTTGTGLLTYLLSFVYVGIYWNNHHHLFQVAGRVTGAMLWANLHLLFWLSMLPLTTAWMDSSGFARVPVIVYGVDLLAAALAWYVLQVLAVRAAGGARSHLAQALGSDLKGKLSPTLYLLGIAAGLLIPRDGGAIAWVAMGFYTVVAAMWLVPDRRLERAATPGVTEDADAS